MKRTMLCAMIVLVAAVSVHAAMDDVIVWEGVRSVSQIEDTLQNGYTSTTDMLLWWDFNNSADLGADASGLGHVGTVDNTVTSLATNTPSADYGTGGLAASGFTTNGSMIVGDPEIPGTDYYTDHTYEMWVRNPHLDGQAVFFSVTRTEAGGGDQDVKRMWVNSDGSLTMGDRGYYTGFQTPTSSALTWEANVWYQVVVAFEYNASDYHDIRVYRGKEGDSTVDLVLDYESSSFGGTHYLAVGAHPKGYYWQNVGAEGFLGADTYVPEPISMVLLAAGGLMTLRKKRR